MYHARLSEPRPAKQLRARFFATEDGLTWEKAPPLTPTERRAVFDRDRWRCCYCDRKVTWTKWESRSPFSDTSVGHVDHIIARARGGSNHPSNLLLACERCNESKGAR